ncbi:MAG: hypothetical protein H0T65_25325, partial [Deltaproteobacteria bacterium]|nr:hypothetical protein [Deltaproteobacteria bacterium]
SKSRSSGSEVPEGSGSANAAASGAAPGSGSAMTVEHGSGSSAVVATGSGSAQTQEGSGSAKVEPPPPPPKTTAKLTFKTKPMGAEILVNGKVLPDVITPMAFEFRISNDPLKITLRKDGYEDIVLDKFVVSDDVTQQLPEFKKKRTSSGTGKGSGKGSAKGSAKGPDDNLMRPD